MPVILAAGQRWCRRAVLLPGPQPIKQATISNFENNPDNTSLTTFFKILQSLELSMTLCDAKNASPEATEQQDLEW